MTSLPPIGGFPRYSGPPAGRGPAEPPAAVETSFLLWLGVAVVVVVRIIVTVLAPELSAQFLSTLRGIPEAEGLDEDQLRMIVSLSLWLVAGVGVAVCGLFTWFAVRMRAGRNWARVILTVGGAFLVVDGVLVFVGSIVGRAGDVRALTVAMATIVIGVLAGAAIWQMNRPEARYWFLPRA